MPKIIEMSVGLLLEIGLILFTLSGTGHVMRTIILLIVEAILGISIVLHVSWTFINKCRSLFRKILIILLIIITILILVTGFGMLVWPTPPQKPLTAEEIANAVVNKIPPASAIDRPYFVNNISPQLIRDKNNNVMFLNWYLINIGKGIATDMLGYSFIHSEGTKDTIKDTNLNTIHPQTWAREFPYGMGTIFHDPSVKMMELCGKQYAYLYIQYKDKVTKKQYSQAYYFERTIYRSGFLEFIEYSDAGKEHKREIDKIRTVGFGYVDKLIKEGADIDKIMAALKKHGVVIDISDL